MQTDLILNRTHYKGYYEDVIQSGGYPIVLSIWPSKQSKSTIIFLPGTGDHPLLYQGFLSKLAIAGYTVIGIHFAGTGKSPRIDTKYRWTTFKKNVCDTVIYARKKFKGKIGLSGSSQGAILTYQMISELKDIDFAICHNIGIPKAKDSIVLTTLPNFLKHVRWIVNFFIGTFAFIFPNFKMPLWVYLNTNGIFSNSNNKDINQQDPIKNKYLPLRFFWQVSTSSLAKSPGTIQMPIFVLASDKDKIFPLDYIQKQYEKIGSTHKKMVILKNEGHMVLVEAAEKSAKSIITWLKSLEKTKAIKA